MMTHTGTLRILVTVGFGLWLAGCGTSGPQPVLFPEIHFQVQPTGQSVFTAELEVGGVLHKFSDPAQPDGMLHFTATSNFNFFVEKAPPPYAGKFTLKGGNDLVVTLSVTGQTTQTGQTSGVGTTTVVGSFSDTLPPPALEVRFDVCVPSLTPGTCFGSGDSGVFGPTFQGNVGDSAQTHLLNAAVPSIYFLENAAESVNGVFTLIPFTGQDLLAQLFLNGALKQTQSGSEDVIIRQDL